MKAYPDANIYVAFALDEPLADLVDEFFRQSLDCKFSLVVSKTTFQEVQMRCENKASLLLRHHIESFNKIGKLEVVERSEKDETQVRQDKNVREFGFNDILHLHLAKKHADVFVTQDRKLRKLAHHHIQTFSLEEFLRTIQH